MLVSSSGCKRNWAWFTIKTIKIHIWLHLFIWQPMVSVFKNVSGISRFRILFEPDASNLTFEFQCKTGKCSGLVWLQFFLVYSVLRFEWGFGDFLLHCNCNYVHSSSSSHLKHILATMFVPLKHEFWARILSHAGYVKLLRKGAQIDTDLDTSAAFLLAQSIPWFFGHFFTKNRPFMSRLQAYFEAFSQSCEPTVHFSQTCDQWVRVKTQYIIPDMLDNHNW